MTDPVVALSEIRAAWAELQQTTKGYTQMAQPLAAGSHWALAQQHVAAAEVALAPPAALGVYREAAAPSEVAQFGTWLGKQPALAHDFFADATWADIEAPTWWLNAWLGWPMLFSVSMIPASGGSLTLGAGGAYDGHYATLAKNLSTYGHGYAIIRPGYEFNGPWFRWSARSDPTSYARYFARIVKAMRAVAPGLRFCWCPTLGGDEAFLSACYPGDDVVDQIGMDVYDQSWIANYTDPAARWQDYVTTPGGLFWLASFATTHGKPVAFPEWGLTIRSDGHGGGDNSYFVRAMHDWIAAHNVAYHCYFEHDEAGDIHRLTGATQFPQGAAAYKAVFGA